MTNTQILAFILGYQGGTVHQIATELSVKTEAILDADDNYMQELCRKAQVVFWKRGGPNGLLVKHLRVCISQLEMDYQAIGADYPAWLERANGVCNIMSECYTQPLAG